MAKEIAFQLFSIGKWFYQFLWERQGSIPQFDACHLFYDI